MHPHFEIPRVRTLARHALPRVIESTIIPVGLFYVFLRVAGVWGAVIAGLGWSYAAIARRLLRGDRVPGLLVLAALGMTVRTAIAAASGSVFLYFLQPSLVTVVVAVAFLLSVPAGKPLAERLAHDFCPLPASLMDRPAIKQVFVRITLLWAFVNLVNATVTIWLLLTTPVAVYVAAKTLVSLAVTAAGIAVSVLWFKRATRDQPAPVPALVTT
jgi:intracellular septation protein A